MEELLEEAPTQSEDLSASSSCEFSFDDSRNFTKYPKLYYRRQKPAAEMKATWGYVTVILGYSWLGTVSFILLSQLVVAFDLPTESWTQEVENRKQHTLN